MCLVNKYMEKVIKLDWDTEFFGKDVFSLKTSSSELIQDTFKSLPQNSLLYVFSDNELPLYANNLVDKKVIFVTSLNSANQDSNALDGVFLCSHTPLSREELVFLSLESSKYSRYRVDSKISNDKADELYIKWIDKAINNPATHEILAFKCDERIAGMIAVKMVGDCCHIELVAVHPNYYRQGIAGKLIKASFQSAINKKINKISVVTQLDNVEACGLYKKYGFKVDTVKYLYHLHK